MRSNPHRPTPQQLACDPELAALAALELMTDLARSALLARHQNIGNEVPEDALTIAACSVIDSADSLRVLLHRYRAALARHYRNMTF
jgi:hypothetical protein